MRKQSKKIALALAAVLSMSVMTPASMQAEAAAKNFTYAEQESGAKVTAVTLRPGEEYDIKFIGVSDWRNYSRKWVSSNEKCATVDKNGNITAVAPGTAKIELVIGDGTVYDSKAVTVNVTAAKTFTYAEQKSGKKVTSVTMEPGDEYDIKFIGVSDWRNYRRQWKSSNEKCATVDKNGNITAVAPGTAKIELLIGDGTVYDSEAVTVYVTDPNPAANPTATPTPRPTSTPIPTPTPEVPKNHTGLGKKAGKINYYVDGKIDRQFVGLAEFEDKWYYVKNGSIDERFTGVAYDEDGLWYVTKGAVDTEYNGTVNYNGNELAVVNGKVDSEFTRVQEDVVLDSPIAREEHKERIWPAGGTLSNMGKWNLSKAGMYRHYCYGEAALYDKFGNKLFEYNNYDGGLLFFMSPIAEDTYKIGGVDVGVHEILEYLGPVIDISGATIVNDAYDSEYEHTVRYTNVPMAPAGDFTIWNDIGLVRVYEYIPEESGEYVIFFDNIEISKGKEKYAKNKLFSMAVDSKEIWSFTSFDEALSKYADVYVTGDNKYTYNFEKGKKYYIKLYVQNVRDSELYLNGDVQFSMNINYVGKTDITGYTTVNDYTMGSMWKTYSITPCRKQNVGFEILDGTGTFTAKVMYNGEVIQQLENLKKGSYFQIDNMMKNGEYDVQFYCTEETEYSLGVYYDVEAEE